MSITVPPKKILVGDLETDSIVVDGTTVTINVGDQGTYVFDTADVEAIFRDCPAPCTKQVIDILPIVPSTPCECPWTWQMQIERNACYTNSAYYTELFNRISAMFSYRDPSGDTPTPADISTEVVRQINLHQDRIVDATLVGGDTIRLTERDCDSDHATCGFKVFADSATVTVVAGHANAVLNAAEINRLFPILPGHIFSRPNIAYCGSLCRYYFRINPVTRVKDPHLMNAYVDRFLELEIFVNQDLADFSANWDATLAATFPSLGGEAS